MKSSTKFQMGGTFHQMKGRLKEIAGKLSDNPKLEAAGMYEKITGKVQEKIGQVKKPARGIFLTAVGIITLVIGATTVFTELQSDLDRIWRVPAPAKENSIWILLRTRLLSFGLVLGLGFLLLVSLVISAAIAAFGKWWDGVFQGWEALLQALNFGISFSITTLLFALLYKLMPRARIAWRDVWVGAGVTALLFETGKFLIGLYLGKTSVASGFGAAGSLVVLLVWVYFAAQVFLLGAEFTWVYSNEYGSKAAQVRQKSTPLVPSRSGGAVDGMDAKGGGRSGPPGKIFVSETRRCIEERDEFPSAC